MLGSHAVQAWIEDKELRKVLEEVSLEMDGPWVLAVGKDTQAGGTREHSGASREQRGVQVGPLTGLPERYGSSSRRQG